jgi:hypothetical protein
VRKHLLDLLVSVAVAALCPHAITETTAGSFTRGCAVRDVQILMLIEEHESTNVIPPQQLGEAMRLMMEARMICRDGHEADALAMYDNAARSLIPMSRRMISDKTESAEFLRTEQTRY